MPVINFAFRSFSGSGRIHYFEDDRERHGFERVPERDFEVPKKQVEVESTEEQMLLHPSFQDGR